MISSKAVVTVDLRRILVTRINKQENARKIYSRATKKYTRDTGEIIDYRAIHEKVLLGSFLLDENQESRERNHVHPSEIFFVVRY